ncbi:MAG: YitT family protein [Bacillota bacterium]
MNRLKKFLLIIFEYTGITLGAVIIALGLSVFLIPNKIAAGGVSGFATIIYYWLNFPIGITMLFINIPLFILSIKVLGLTFATRSLYGITVLSFLIELFQGIVPVITQDLLLAAIYGGLLSGLGLGLVFRFNGTTGGTDMVAGLINYYTGISMGEGLFIADGLIVSLAGIFFNIEVALYAAISIFIISKTIDMVQEGFGISKMVIIISDYNEKIRKKIINELDRGLTSLKGFGGYTSKEKEVLMCIISRSEVSKLKRMVYETDKEAFVTISNIHEVLGEGFKKID